MVRLGAVADVVAEIAHVAQDQGLAADTVLAVPGALAGITLARLGGVQHAPGGEVAHQLLVAVSMIA